MGEVYEARHRVLGRRFAIKLLHPELARSQRMLRRFSREALSASRIENDHVVAIADCGHLPGGAPYYVMDFLRGRDLRNLLRECGPLPIPRAARLVRQICVGLAAAHELGLVHRDLKPENIFVERRDDGQDCAKILDFGVVQTQGGNSTARPGALIGTLRYMAPEQARGDAALDHRADLYAVGSILYECLTGKVPHPGRNAEEVLFNIMTQSPVSVDELRADVPSDLVNIARRALSKDPRGRFQSAVEFAQALSAHTGPNIVERYSHHRYQGAKHEPTIDGRAHALNGAASVTKSMGALFAWRTHWGVLAAIAVVLVAVFCTASRNTSPSSSSASSKVGGNPSAVMVLPPSQSSSSVQLTASSAFIPLPSPRSTESPRSAKPERAPARRSRPPQPPASAGELVRGDEYSQTLDSRNPYASSAR